ncbi:MAG: hypothetical protein NTX73_01410 [Rhodobacterales bacterium]|nr:hypothetical protein [Rhodobacterales bacterium]
MLVRFRTALFGAAVMAALAATTIWLTKPDAADNALTTCRRDYQPALCLSAKALPGDNVSPAPAES